MGYYDYGYYDVPSSSVGNTFLAGFGTYMFVMIALSIFMIVCNWKIYKKAGKGGWEAIVPIYSNIVLLQIAGLPAWYIVLCFIPFANIYVAFKTNIELAHKFGKSTGFGVASVFFGIICLPILAFSKCEYNGLGNTTSNNMNNNYQNNQPNNNYSQNFNNVQTNYSNSNFQNQNVNSYVQSTQPVQPTVNSNLQGQPGIYQNNGMNYQQPTQSAVTQNNQMYTNINALNSQQNVQPQSQAFVNNQSMPTGQTSQVMEKTCPYCGTKVDSSASFCFMCGKNIQ